MICKDDFWMVERARTEQHMFNVAFIGAPRTGNWGSKTFLEAYDFCSGRRVRVDPRSLLDLYSIWQNYTRHNSSGVYVQYKDMTKLTVGGSEVYQISGLSAIPKGWVDRKVQEHGGQEGVTGMNDCFRSSLR